MNHSAHRDVIVQPVSRQQTAGAFVDGSCIEQSLLVRNYPKAPHPIQIVSAATPEEPVESVDGPTIFAGYLFAHFGHFLLESLSRLWLARERPDHRLVWCLMGDFTEYTPWQGKILDLLGVRNEALFLRSPTRFERLLIPEQGYVIQDTFHRQHADFLGVVEPAPMRRGNRCWISRSRLSPESGGLQDEEEVESRLARRGWQIFHPQDHSITEQLGFLSSSETIAGLPGSAFHSLILLKRLESRIKLVQLRPANRNYTTIASTRGFDQEWLSVASVAGRKAANPSQDRVALADPRELVEALAT
jgi:capsular polysaccharide biosynthesis protein